MFRQRSQIVLCSLALAGLLLVPTHTEAFGQSATASEVDRITNALTPRRTRGLKVQAADSKSNAVIDRLKDVRRTRGLSHREQDELHVATEAMPQLDLEIYFAFNSAEIDTKALPTLSALGQALNKDSLKGSTIVIGGHTDRKGTPDYNQTLSDRRAQAVASYLTETHKIDASRILASGYGFRKPKLPNEPYADANRRVQIVNAAR